MRPRMPGEVPVLLRFQSVQTGGILQVGIEAHKRTMGAPRVWFDENRILKDEWETCAASRMIRPTA
jgi:hypothetical protein